MAELKFPKGFLWGASTAAHQVEGGQDNNWSHWEPTVARELAQTAMKRLSGKVPDYDLIKNEAEDPQNYISGQAVDHYNRYDEDFGIMKKLGLNAYRFSIEWSRIEPKPGEINQAGLDHYRAVMDVLIKHDIEPIISLHHFANPAWFDELGGWHNKQAPNLFAKFAGVISQKLGDDIKYWATINEPGSYILMRYLGGGAWPQWPQMEGNLRRGYICLKNFAHAHKLAYKRIKEVNPVSMVGMVNALVDFEPGRRDPLSVAWKKMLGYLPDEYLLNRIDGHNDFIGANYYIHLPIKSKLALPRNWVTEDYGNPQNDMGWNIYPKGIYNVTQRVKKYKLPIIITENGIPDSQDRQRAEFIRDHLFWLHKSIQDGADIKGYLYWSLLDNFEWSEGFWPKFGLVAVDRKTMERKIRPSAYEYAKIAKSNCLS